MSSFRGTCGSIVLRLAAALLLPGVPLPAKDFEYGGFVQATGQFYAATPYPSDTHANGTLGFQLWSRAEISKRLSWRGTWDMRLDTHRDVDRTRWLDVSQRGLRLPAGAVNEFYFDLKLNHVDIRAGRQTIRWGRADGFNPTDNLVPYDYLDTFADVRLPVHALKVDAYQGNARVEFVWVPVYTPTRLPLAGQRWYPRLPDIPFMVPGPDGTPTAAQTVYRDVGGRFPAATLGNGQWGARWNLLVPGAEFSFSYFDGYDDIPDFDTVETWFIMAPAPRLQFDYRREYRRARVAGADFASSLGPFGLRGEAAWFAQAEPTTPDHLLFVVGVDRSWGDWSAILQYAGQKLAGSTEPQALFPDLSLRSTVLWRLNRTIGAGRSFELKGAVRLRDGDFLIQPSYTVSITNNWRLKLGASILGGPEQGYLGQFRDNSGPSVELRYSF